jgi:DNA-binding protein YbaB
MFDKIQKLRQVQNALKQEKVKVEKQGISLTINGSFEIEEIILDSSSSKQEQEQILKSCFNEAIKKIQMIAAQKMSSLGGF